MNAPWKPGSGSNRDAFAAYICDEASLDVMRTVVAELGWAPEKCNKGSLRNAVQSLSVSSSPNVLLVDLSESGDPLTDINALAEVCEPGTVVIAIGQINDVRLYRELVASGIQDYLLKPLTPAHVHDALTHAQSVFSTPKHAEAVANAHISTVVIGTRGGVGASTVATSLAWLFGSEYKQATALLDLDIHFGSGALTFDLEPGRGLTDAIETPSRIDGLFMERAMVRANDFLSLLSSEAPINQPLLTDGGAFLQLQEEYRNSFQRTVIDLPRQMLINFPQLMAGTDVVVVVTELTLAGARDAIRIISWLKAHAAHTKVLVAVNRIQSIGTEISKSDFEASIEHKTDQLIVFDHKAAINAAKLGQTFAEANRLSKAGINLRDLAKKINVLGGMILAEEAEGDKKGGKPVKAKGDKPGGLKSLFAKKEKASA